MYENIKIKQLNIDYKTTILYKKNVFYYAKLTKKDCASTSLFLIHDISQLFWKNFYIITFVRF